MAEEKFVEELEVVYDGDVKLSTIVNRLYGKVNLFTGPNPNDLILKSNSKLSLFRRRPENDDEKVERLTEELKRVLGHRKAIEYLEDKLFAEEAH